MYKIPSLLSQFCQFAQFKCALPELVHFHRHELIASLFHAPCTDRLQCFQPQKTFRLQALRLNGCSVHSPCGQAGAISWPDSRPFASTFTDTLASTLTSERYRPCSSNTSPRPVKTASSLSKSIPYVAFSSSALSPTCLGMPRYLSSSTCGAISSYSRMLFPRESKILYWPSRSRSRSLGLLAGSADHR